MNIFYRPNNTQYPAVVDFDGSGIALLRPLPNNDPSYCPVTHFMCPEGGFCLPVYVRCNGINDCPSAADEVGCEGLECLGLYRCLGSQSVCLHVRHVCDGWSQCPQHDDERFCRLSCPENCTCFALSFRCRRRRFPAQQHPRLRYFDGRGSGLLLGQFRHSRFLIHLSLANCGISAMEAANNSNLRSLDLSNNEIRVIAFAHLGGVGNLRVFFLANNPITSLFQSNAAAPEINNFKLQQLDLSNVEMQLFNASVLSPFLNLRHLNLSHSRIKQLSAERFGPLTQIRSLDFRGCSLFNVSSVSLKTLRNLTTLFVDDHRLCCPALLPVKAAVDCSHTDPSDTISTCSDLIGLEHQRVTLWVTAAVSLVTNTVVGVMTVLRLRNNPSLFSLLLVQLCASDWLMGAHVAITVSSDVALRGSYVLAETAWRRSATCRVSGVFATLSHVASAGVLCYAALLSVATLYRRAGSFPRGRAAAGLTCGAVWLVGLMFSAIPVSETTPFWDQHAGAGVCRPPFIAGGSDKGEVIVSITLAVFNLTVSTALFSSFLGIRTKATSTADLLRGEEDAADESLQLGYRMAYLVLLNGFCRAAIGLSGLVVSRALTPVTRTSVLVVVIPLSSALDPCVYLMTSALQHRRHGRRQRLLRMLLARRKQLMR